MASLQRAISATASFVKLTFRITRTSESDRHFTSYFLIKWFSYFWSWVWLALARASKLQGPPSLTLHSSPGRIGTSSENYRMTGLTFHTISKINQRISSFYLFMSGRCVACCCPANLARDAAEQGDGGHQHWQHQWEDRVCLRSFHGERWEPGWNRV